ncbi:hypothetical protein NDU88_001517 [Pleurodeles waltl]|uniref:Uncharacterized protein n=1 Tax=Pleurodeles waltl TaxID=8319 RepID=A0AAV7MNY6_PLEWA|nr:hypothetical protein NDU88_001517 [Pleurodeles waltl]
MAAPQSQAVCPSRAALSHGPGLEQGSRSLNVASSPRGRPSTPRPLRLRALTSGVPRRVVAQLCRQRVLGVRSQLTRASEPPMLRFEVLGSSVTPCPPRLSRISRMRRGTLTARVRHV